MWDVLLNKLVDLAKANCGQPIDTWEAYEAVPPPPPLPTVPVVVEREAEASEPTREPEVEEQVSLEGLIRVTSVKPEYCPAPTVHTVHPEQVTVVVSIPSFLEKVVRSEPAFVPKEELANVAATLYLPPRRADIHWVLPPCLHD